MTDEQKRAERRENKLIQIWLSIAAAGGSLLAIVFANQSDNFGNATMVTAATMCGILAGLAILILLVLRTSLWVDD